MKEEVRYDEKLKNIRERMKMKIETKNFHSPTLAIARQKLKKRIYTRNKRLFTLKKKITLTSGHIINSKGMYRLDRNKTELINE